MAAILVVEDNENQGVIIQRALERDGHAVLVLLDTGQVEQAFLRMQPKLVITDVDMVSQSGINVIQTIKAVDASVPVIVFTAMGRPDVEEAARKAGCDAYLTKPMSVVDLREFITQFLKDYYRDSDSNPGL